MRKQYQSPKVKILVLSGRKLMDDWVIGGTVVSVQGAKDASDFGSDDYEDYYPNKVNVWDY